MKRLTFIRYLTGCLFLLNSSFSQANEINKPITKKQSPASHQKLSKYGDFWDSISKHIIPSTAFYKLGFGFKSETSPYRGKKDSLSLLHSGRFEWDSGLFIEISNGYNEITQGHNIGYNFYNTEHWSFDLSTMQAHGNLSLTTLVRRHKISTDYYSQEVVDRYNAKGGMKHKEIESRKKLSAVGLRATGRFDQTNIQLTIAPFVQQSEALTNVSDIDHGVYASLWLAHYWQVKNWELHASLGAKYRSGEIIDYYYGVHGYPANINNFLFDFPEYNAKAGINVSAQIGLSYPISKKWLFDSYYRYTNLARSITDSPFMKVAADNENSAIDVSEFGIAISYIWF